jgi:DNA-binding transcriptional LysR family regulator
MTDDLSELRFGDLTTFLAVQRTGSLTGAARELKVTPSQVSKAVARLECQFRMKLLSRSSRGVALSELGMRIAPDVEDAVARMRGVHRARSTGTNELTIAAPSYMIAVFLPCIVSLEPPMRLRGLELPPPLLRAYASQNFFDLTLVPSGIDWLPASWMSAHVGHFRKGLFGTPELAKRLGSMPVAPEKLRAIPFISPVFHNDGRFVPVDDDCPLRHNERVLGHEAQAIGLGLELASRTHQLVFGPVMAASRFVEKGALVEIHVRGWLVTEALYFASNRDRVKARVHEAIAGALREELAKIGIADHA